MRSWLVVAGGIALLLGGAACDESPPSRPNPEPPPEWTPERTREAETLSDQLAALAPDDPGGLRVVLAFGARADLDLYVTDPLEETVYYGNTPSRSGGALVEDRRCVHEAPRIETVRFPQPLVPGRYRVGVDYPRACDEAKTPAPFAVSLDGPGGRTTHRGLARHEVFEPIVLEVVIAPASAAGADGQHREEER